MVVAAIAAIVLLACMAGWVYEERAEAADARRFPPPGVGARIAPSSAGAVVAAHAHAARQRLARF